jgi:serine/threonine-protein kinase
VPEAATESRRPVTAKPSRAVTPPRGLRRTWSDESAQADAEERRRALPKMFLFVLVAWLLFGVLDVYIALVAPNTPLAWMIEWRIIGAVPPLVGWLTTRKRSRSNATTTALEMATFIGTALCISMRALRYGGLDSHLLQGISLILMIQTMAVASPWRRMLPLAMATYAVYPVVMALAATSDATLAAQWRGHEGVLFVQDYLLVAGVAVGGTVGGHMVWAVRRQLYYARRLGRYRLKARIGHGGMSEVWLAWDDALKRDAALKILDRSFSSDAVAIARFEREAMAASGLQSPHTIRVFDFGASDDGVWFMAMEHLEGVDLATLVEEGGPLSAPRTIRFARQACTALTEAHDAGIIHRDIKPDNLFVCRLGDEPDFLKVLDFGIAKIEGADEDATVTRAGWVHGTPAYMSPEVCNGQRADARSDVYSLGAVLYYLVTGTPPFTAPTAAAVMLAHVSDPPDRPSLRAPVPLDLERIVLRCLEKDPAARYPSARELDAALAGCRDSEGWRRESADAFWTSFHRKPPAATSAAAGGKAAPGDRALPTDETRSQPRPSARSGIKVG